MEKKQKTQEQREAEEPKWISIVSDLIDTFKIEEVIPHEYLKSKFNISDDIDFVFDEGTLESINLSEIRGILNQNDLKYMNFIDKIWHTSLKKFRLLFKNVYGEGYKFVDARNQTDIALKQFEDDMKRSFNECQMILNNIRIEDLDQDKRKQNADAIAAISMKKQILKNGYR